ncbi:MAG: putative type secretion system integral rane subunit [Thermoleophilia bacterium]|nr:putative type secretion system integral rane subunit [Thermoleophilia bacterium]
MSFRTTRLATTFVVALAVAVAGSCASALAADRDSANGVSITAVDSSRFPIVRVAFGADEVKGKEPDLNFFEGSTALPAASLYRGEIGEFEDARHTDVMLVVDTSLSMGTGSRIDDAIDAANQLIDRARSGDRIGLATFGGSAAVVVKPTGDLERVRSALRGIELSNRTTMFDAVSMSARAFGSKMDSNRAIVLLSDGTDVGSVETLDEAAGEALKAQAPIFAIAIRENADDQPKDLAELGNGTGGELHTVVGTAGLETLFSELGRRILQPYWVEYKSSAPQGSALQFGIAIGDRRSDIVVKRSFRGIPSASAAGRAGGGDLPNSTPAKPLLPVPGGMVGVLVASFPFALLIFSFVWMMLQRRTKPDILARLDLYTTRATADTVVRREEQQSLFRRLGSPIMKLSESFLGGSAFFERTRKRAEQASIAVKPSEMFTAMLAAGALGALVGLMLGSIVFTGLIGVPAFYLPMFWLRFKARKRRNMFDDQLPDVLQGISSSLKAGHSFNQALNAMIKDSPNPTAEEFSRVMTEARLGMPLEDALQHMADRMGSADFEFAVTTVNIQRTVGGSLADILQMVGDTVRNRQQFRKKVKALSSMGTMSAYVLLGMPIFIGLALTVINASYMAPLFTTDTGHLLLVVGAFSMTLGYFACMKVVAIKI